jgi:citrate lyase subunit beta/citryl-CoA lyase
MRHPSQVLFAGEKPFPMIPAVDHYAGSEKLINKALLLQNELGPIFDITCDCEDGAPAGADREHATMVAELIMSAANRHGRVGVRIHDIAHHGWQQDIEIIVAHAGQRLAFVTLPKVSCGEDVRIQLRRFAARGGSRRHRAPDPGTCPDRNPRRLACGLGNRRHCRKSNRSISD